MVHSKDELIRTMLGSHAVACLVRICCDVRIGVQDASALRHHAPQELARSRTRELPKLPREMRLVEVAAFESNVRQAAWPLRRQHLDRALEADYPGHLLRRQADFVSKAFNELLRLPIQRAAEVIDSNQSSACLQPLKRPGHTLGWPRRNREAVQRHLLNQIEASVPVRRVLEPLNQPVSPGA